MGEDLIVIPTKSEQAAAQDATTHLPAIVQNSDLRPSVEPSASGILQIAKACALSGYYADVRNASQALVKMMAGKEMGVGPVRALSLIHIIEGKPSASAALLAEAIKRSGKYDYRVIQRDDQACILEWTERGEVVGRSQFTIEDAKTAELAHRKNWKKHPRAMLFARALTEGKTAYAPDVLAGVYTHEELAPDLEVNELGEASQAAWNDFFAGSEPEQQARKERPLSAMEMLKQASEQAGTTPLPPRGPLPPEAPASEPLLASIRAYLVGLKVTREKAGEIVRHYGVEKLNQLTQGQAVDLAGKLAGKLAAKGNATLHSSIAACEAQLAAPAPAATVAAGAAKIRPDQIETLKVTADLAYWPQVKRIAWLDQRGYQSFRDATEVEATELIAKLQQIATAQPKN